MKIGTEEIIYWLRKNEMYKSISNEVLGKNIRKIIEGLGGKLQDTDVRSKWGNEKNVDRFNLPQTSAQYEIDFEYLTDLYEQVQKIEH